MIRKIADRFPWPRTLLWRSFLMIALLLGGCLLAWVQIYNHYALRPRAIQAARLVVSMVNLTRTALVAADESQRLALVRELDSLEGIRVILAEPADKTVDLPTSAASLQLQERVRKRLGQYTRFATELNGEEGFLVSFRVDENDPEDEYWVMLPKERIFNPAATDWISWGAIVALIALLSAYALVRGLNRPLQALENAARAIGRGETPSALPEHGAREVAAVAQAFNQMSQDLAELDSDRALILAGVSHDLRTPLARLRLGIEMSGAQAADIAAMGQDIEEMDRIIGQFLDFARGSDAEPLGECDLSSLVSEVVQLFQRRAATVSLEAAPNIRLSGRSKSLRRAISNLIDNALRYAGTDSPIDVAVWVKDGTVTIQVADRGPGIPADQVERLKRPFTRLETARSNVHGSGLGLAIVERIARQHGGSLDLLPREGGGLRARLLLHA